MNGKILIVEDDRSFGTMLLKWFERNGISATLCNGMLSAQEKLSEPEPFDVVLSDLRLPDGDGIMLLSWLKEENKSIPVIIMTGYGEIQTAVSAIKLGAFDFLEKPINPSVLTQKIESALESVNTKKISDLKKTESSKSDASPLKKKPNASGVKIVVGKSALSKQMYSYIDLVAPTQMSVMIVGESGTGKEHVARMIHERSTRAKGPFIAVDCGSLSTELAPSELFGHKKGSFTSAIEDKTGFFRDANGGTLFLDEVGNLPYGVQMQMLRSLQEKKIRSIGTSNDIEVDVRILTATNENLELAISEGKFREDLYHRLNEFMILVPSLRECIEDIKQYADHFREEANTELDKSVKYITQEAMERLEQYSWPGNLRELRNVIRRSVLFSLSDEITVENLPVLKESIEEISNNDADIALFYKSENEKEKIITALKKTNGNKSKAAILLNIDRKTLYNKIHLYNIKL
ncbi:MAG: sigma-54 dependent transcriptional regulator [Fermentimonas sp.]|nr:sigma-54 dependent transcriptional regulator [Fermentimonas sp.]MDD3510338.1 sigma-54 dependent transcriptional regulator [Fermentimonas sp.]MDD4284262.1 sigma-54 dependent transcriptional regulator [Fermentimonas sp.]